MLWYFSSIQRAATVLRTSCPETVRTIDLTLKFLLQLIQHQCYVLRVVLAVINESRVVFFDRDISMGQSPLKTVTSSPPDRRQWRATISSPSQRGINLPRGIALIIIVIILTWKLTFLFILIWIWLYLRGKNRRNIFLNNG